VVIGFAKNEKPKTKNEKKGSPILSMELPLPSGVAALTKKQNLQNNRQAGLLALGSAGGGQPSHRRSL
jgi:hypothetical protein